MKTDFTQIIFDPSNHSYTYGNHLLISATRRLSKLKKPFDAQYWAKKKAEEQGVSVEAILKQWDDDRRRSMDRGDHIHTLIAQFLRAGLTGEAPGVRVEGLTEFDSFRDYWTHTVNPHYTRVYQVEWVIGDAELGLAGTADLLTFNLEDEKYHLWDWKTGSKFKLDNRFQTLLPPFADLDDCEFINYSLQLSLYRLFIERNTDLPLGDSYLCYLPSYGGCATYTALDLRQRLLEWLSPSAPLPLGGVGGGPGGEGQWLSPRPLGEGAGGEGQ